MWLMAGLPTCPPEPGIELNENRPSEPPGSITAVGCLRTRQSARPYQVFLAWDGRRAGCVRIRG
jgi:hypothetical protein